MSFIIIIIIAVFIVISESTECFANLLCESDLRLPAFEGNLILGISTLLGPGSLGEAYIAWYIMNDYSCISG